MNAWNLACETSLQLSRSTVDVRVDRIPGGGAAETRSPLFVRGIPNP